MASDIEQHVQHVRVVDTHEHMNKEAAWVQNGPEDVLAALLNNYVAADLQSAGATAAAVKRLMDGSDPDVEGRWAGIEEAWRAIQFTGYAQAVQQIANTFFQIENITPQALRAAQPKLEALRQPGQRLHILRDVANLDHIQTDDTCWLCLPDASGPDFFLYDLSWLSFCNGQIDTAALAEETGITVKDLATLSDAMAKIFELHGPCAIAVKSQHAYHRTLRWIERSDTDADKALGAVLADAERADEETRLCLGDWCWARGAELAGQHGLPFKIHTGYYAGAGHMIVDRIRPGHLCPLLIKYPDTRFVLMHIAYPYGDELIALSKHFPNAWSDLCWAWSINPAASMEFVRRFLHAAPANKLFAFGGDTQFPTTAHAYGAQMRHHLARALAGEVSDGDMTEAQAIDVATRLMRQNQLSCFDVAGTQSNITAAATAAAPA